MARHGKKALKAMSRGKPVEVIPPFEPKTTVTVTYVDGETREMRADEDGRVPVLFPDRTYARLDAEDLVWLPVGTIIHPPVGLRVDKL